MVAETAQERSLLLRGGTVVTASDLFVADVLVRGEKIVAVGLDEGLTADEVLDVTGSYVMPGGIDVHTHLEYQSVTQTADDFFTGTRAAAFGGTTTVVDFAKPDGTEDLYTAYKNRQEAAASKAVIDYSFHSMITARGLDDGGVDHMRQLADQGVTSFKFLMAYPGRMMVDDATLLAGMKVAAELDLLITLHAENGHMVTSATADLVEGGRTSEHEHLQAHPAIAEAEAVQRAVALSRLTGASIYIVHVSSALVTEIIEKAQADGLPVWGETCPQYLFSSYEEYRDLGFDAAKYVCSPPIRERANQFGLWEALQKDVLSVVATDHAAFRMEDKRRGQDFFPNVPSGVPGIEERLMLMYDGGVRTGKISVNRFVDLVATKPAKLFGLYPRKGTLAIGSDADIVVWDPDRQHKLTVESQHSAADYNLYEGREVTGFPSVVLSRGSVIVADGEFRGEPGRGEYLARDSGSRKSLMSTAFA